MPHQIKDALPPLRRTLLQWLRGSFLKGMFDPYHPEQHKPLTPGASKMRRPSAHDRRAKPVTALP
jgi:hypothetical protein